MCGMKLKEARILVVDDNEELCRLVQSICIQEGFSLSLIHIFFLKFRKIDRFLLSVYILFRNFGV